MEKINLRTENKGSIEEEIINKYKNLLKSHFGSYNTIRLNIAGTLETLEADAVTLGITEEDIAASERTYTEWAKENDQPNPDRVDILRRCITDKIDREINDSYPVELE